MAVSPLEKYYRKPGQHARSLAQVFRHSELLVLAYRQDNVESLFDSQLPEEKATVVTVEETDFS